jgi:8-oxo-dGTP diphosphatase
MSDQYKYCPFCANLLQPFSDGERLRARCPACGWIHYRNPTVGVAVVLLEPAGLLLGERRDGGWCIPCGNVEWDESVREAARREFLEETGLDVELSSVLAVHSNMHASHYHTVGVWYLGRRIGGNLRAGGDLIRVAHFPFHGMPSLKFINDHKVVELLRAGLLFE